MHNIIKGVPSVINLGGNIKMDSETKKYKHLTLSERIQIESELNQRTSLKKISKQLNRPTSI